jgi:hypothetical protein
MTAPSIIPDYASDDEMPIQPPNKIKLIPSVTEILSTIKAPIKAEETTDKNEHIITSVITDTTKEGKKIQTKLERHREKSSQEKFENWVNSAISNNRVIKNCEPKPKKGAKVKKKRKIVSSTQYASECYQMLKTAFE